jgi:hypothetical protein
VRNTNRKNSNKLGKIMAGKKNHNQPNPQHTREKTKFTTMFDEVNTSIDGASNLPEKEKALAELQGLYAEIQKKSPQNRLLNYLQKQVSDRLESYTTTVVSLKLRRPTDKNLEIAREWLEKAGLKPEENVAYKGALKKLAQDYVEFTLSFLQDSLANAQPAEDVWNGRRPTQAEIKEDIDAGREPVGRIYGIEDVYMICAEHDIDPKDVSGLEDFKQQVFTQFLDETEVTYSRRAAFNLGGIRIPNPTRVDYFVDEKATNVERWDTVRELLDVSNLDDEEGLSKIEKKALSLLLDGLDTHISRMYGAYFQATMDELLDAIERSDDVSQLFAERWQQLSMLAEEQNQYGMSSITFNLTYEGASVDWTLQQFMTEARQNLSDINQNLLQELEKEQKSGKNNKPDPKRFESLVSLAYEADAQRQAGSALVTLAQVEGDSLNYIYERAKTYLSPQARSVFEQIQEAGHEVASTEALFNVFGKVKRTQLPAASNQTKYQPTQADFDALQSIAIARGQEDATRMAHAFAAIVGVSPDTMVTRIANTSDFASTFQNWSVLTNAVTQFQKNDPEMQQPDVAIQWIQKAVRTIMVPVPVVEPMLEMLEGRLDAKIKATDIEAAHHFASNAMTAIPLRGALEAERKGLTTVDAKVQHLQKTAEILALADEATIRANPKEAVEKAKVFLTKHHSEKAQKGSTFCEKLAGELETYVLKIAQEEMQGISFEQKVGETVVELAAPELNEAIQKATTLVGLLAQLEIVEATRQAIIQGTEKPTKAEPTPKNNEAKDKKPTTPPKPAGTPKSQTTTQETDKEEKTLTRAEQIAQKRAEIEARRAAANNPQTPQDKAPAPEDVPGEEPEEGEGATNPADTPTETPVPTVTNAEGGLDVAEEVKALTQIIATIAENYLGKINNGVFAASKARELESSLSQLKDNPPSTPEELGGALRTLSGRIKGAQTQAENAEVRGKLGDAEAYDQALSGLAAKVDALEQSLKGGGRG